MTDSPDRAHSRDYRLLTTDYRLPTLHCGLSTVDCRLGQHRHRNSSRPPMRSQSRAALHDQDVGLGIAGPNLPRQRVGQARGIAVRDTKTPLDADTRLRRLEEKLHHLLAGGVEAARLRDRL